MPGDLVFVKLGLANEEHVKVISVDTANQTFTAIVTENHPAGSSIRPFDLADGSAPRRDVNRISD